MASYKVPQDVEADDKLIGPFSFRQFIYLAIASVAAFLAYLLSRIFLPLLLLPLPVTLFFGVLALPLRKDQPMEIYLAAVVSFLFKPRMRLWSPEGTISLVTITVPEKVNYDLTKGIAGSEAQRQLSYLAQVVDTGGWSTRGVTPGIYQSNLDDTYAAEALATTDIMDNQAPVSKSFDNLINKSMTSHYKQITEQFSNIDNGQPNTITPHSAQDYVQAPQTSQFPPAPTINPNPVVPEQATDRPTFNPYPTMHQKIIPANNAEPSPQSLPENVVPESVSPDIMRLAGNKDLSISAIAREAHRLEEKEVVVSLR